MRRVQFYVVQPVRFFTVDQANAAIERIDDVLARAQKLTAELRNVRDQLVDLRIIWGTTIMDPKCPDYDEYEAYQGKFVERKEQLGHVLDEVHHVGCEVKDVELGLVDFHSKGRSEPVYLCWQRGEQRVQFWHGVHDGFQGRQPIETL